MHALLPECPARLAERRPRARLVSGLLDPVRNTRRLLCGGAVHLVPHVPFDFWVAGSPPASGAASEAVGRHPSGRGTPRLGDGYGRSMATIRLGSVALDCSDPAPLADFWAALLGGDVAFRSDEFCAVKTADGWLAAVRVDEFKRPTWPDPSVPKQMHLDLNVQDLDAAQDEAVRLGAQVAPAQPAPERWRVLLDPAGHPFCLSTQIPD